MALIIYELAGCYQLLPSDVNYIDTYIVYHKKGTAT